MTQPAPAIPVLIGCPPRTGPWPERFAFECTCCKVTAEIFVTVSADRKEPLAERRVRTDAAVLALSGTHRWLLVKGPGTAEWVCDNCWPVALDHDDPAVADAFRRHGHWSRMDVQL